MMRNSYRTLVLSVIAISVLTACGDEDEKKAPTQVVARVNDKELTVHQLNYMLQRQPKADDATKQKALDALIDQEILVQKAEELKLDRDPSVVQAVEHAKRQILAQAALGKLDTQKNPDMSKSIGEFYEKNPNLFADRKIYVFDSFIIEKTAFNDELRAGLDTMKTADETLQLLTEKNVKAARQELKRPAEQLPLEALAKVATMPPGDILILPQGDKVVLLQLREAIPAPVTQQQAEPVIKQYLSNKTKMESLQNSVESLKKNAKIEYVQKFNAGSTSAGDKSAQPDSGNVDTNAIKEGLKGTK